MQPIGAAAALAILISCGGSADGTDEAPALFAVDATTPADQAAAVPRDSNVTIRWNQPVDCSTVSTDSVTTTSPGWTLMSCRDSHAIFYPTGQRYESSYQVTVGDSVRSASGASLSAPLSVTYSTASAPESWGGTLLEGGPGVEAATDGVADPAGNIYLVGRTSSGLFGTVNAGNDDVFVAKYDASGTIRAWGVQFGGSGNDRGLAVAVGNAGVYIAGSTFAGDFAPALPGDALAKVDAFIAKLDPADGAILWIRRFGTIQDDSARAVDLDADGNIYVAGTTRGTMAGNGSAQDEDAFLARFNDGNAGDGAPGSRTWVNQFGQDATAEDAATVKVADDFIYIAGKTGIVDSQGDAYVSRHALSDGSQLTQWRLGQPGLDYANDLAIDARGHLYIAGRSETDIDGDALLVQSVSDAFLAKVDPGTVAGVEWVEVLASTGEDEAFGVALDAFSNLYVAGAAGNDLVGETNGFAGVSDAFVGRFTTDGDRNWFGLLGSAAADAGAAVFTSGRGALFVAGVTNGDFAGAANANAGAGDAFVARFTSAGELE